ncbi:hypothetical protein [Nocardia sp. NPDC004260]
MISWAVVAHTKRLVQATELARTLGAVIALDDGSKGAEDNHLEAWRLTATTEGEWSAVVEDDAIPVYGITEQAEHALANAPAPVVSFYLGRSRPIRWQHRIHSALHHSDVEGAHWITTSHVLHAVAVAMRSELRDDWIEWAHTSQLPADERLSAWCKTRGHRVAYTVPSLVDHGDGPTLIAHRDGQPRTAPRIAWRTGTRDVWSNRAVSM